MPEQARLYDLMVVLSTTADEERRTKILADIEAQIADGGGTVDRNDDWHSRPLAYEINHQTEGEYRLFQFTGPTSLLEPISHNLRIDDAVLRFRIIRVIPGTPPAPDSPPPVVAGATAAPAPAAAAPASVSASDEE